MDEAFETGLGAVLFVLLGLTCSRGVRLRAEGAGDVVAWHRQGCWHQPMTSCLLIAAQKGIRFLILRCLITLHYHPSILLGESWENIDMLFVDSAPKTTVHTSAKI